MQILNEEKQISGCLLFWKIKMKISFCLKWSEKMFFIMRTEMGSKTSAELNF